ncbi:chaplin family protein [Actinomadura darangshiensis]|uniref:chaplin family protein n=1 Tax=Actinomadura darangshiensis TaxID=705336 RepID=UPI001FB577FD|nr:chaplin family protein [Actinomadura darangshiensis]
MFKKLAATGILGFAVAGSALAATPAYAATYGGGWDHHGHHGHGHPKYNAQSSGNFGLLNGNNVIVPISAAVDVCGNAVAVIGVAGAGCKGGASSHN